ncbi:MAG: phosphoglycerate kinase [Phycisphaerae bacterium]|nr:phosphoglycerate kinase [Phycisphaerae bacterium]
MAKKTVADIDPKGKRVLMRVDFNVPIADGKVGDDKRIVAAIPTIKNIIERGGKLILMSHLGRPKGSPSPEFSLKPAADRLGELLEKPVKFVDDAMGDKVKTAVNSLNDGDVLVLENMRFYKQEEANDETFSKQLAALGDIYVNDAFGTAHRCHASTHGVARFITGPKVVGFLIEKELKYLDDALNNPTRPFVAILGGAKVSDKIEVIKNLLSKVDKLLIGGAMAYTFMKAQGKPTGNSLVEADKVDLAKDLIKIGGDKLVLPLDTICGKEFKEDTPTMTAEGNIPDGWEGFDIGPKTVELFKNLVVNAKTIVWNGPLGVFEMKPFANGTFSLAQTIADATAKGAVSVIGGGDSASAIKKAGLNKAMTHISTGGGASLEFMEGKGFETLDILDNK